MQVICKSTGKAIECKATPKGNPRLPRGWKWRGGDAYSPDAWHSLYSLRAITVPIVSPHIEDASPSRLKEAWKLLGEQLKQAWQRSTEAANWAAKRLWSGDVTRQAGIAKCPAMPSVYLYGERDWTGWASSAQCVLRTIEQSYRRRRYEIVWTGSAGVPFVRYPYPYPVHNASWNLEQLNGGEVVFDCRLPSGRTSMKLRTRDKSGRYRLDALGHLIANPDLRGEAAIIKRANGEIAVKLVGWFPKTIREQAGMLKVRTDTQSFLVLLNERDERLLIINGDYIRRKLAAHSHGLQRWREDMKFEARIPKRKSRKKAEDMQAACLKMSNRLNSFIDETCAQVVGHAIRRKLLVVRLDDTERIYFRDFAWYRLREKLKQVCDREGLQFECSSAEPDAVTSRSNVTPMEVDQ